MLYAQNANTKHLIEMESQSVGCLVLTKCVKAFCGATPLMVSFFVIVRSIQRLWWVFSESKNMNGKSS